MAPKEQVIDYMEMARQISERTGMNTTKCKTVTAEDIADAVLNTVVQTHGIGVLRLS